jgi:hypothetical protein
MCVSARWVDKEQGVVVMIASKHIAAGGWVHDACMQHVCFPTAG